MPTQALRSGSWSPAVVAPIAIPLWPTAEPIKFPTWPVVDNPDIHQRIESYLLPEINEPVAELAKVAFSILEHNLIGYGNKLSEQHRLALMSTIRIFSVLAARAQTGRWAIPLDTGYGKSQAIVAWIAAVHRLGLPYSVTVACSKVEALCEMKRNLRKAGVPDDKIGLWHNKLYDSNPQMIDDVKHGRAPKYATEPASGDYESRQFLLVTHERVRGDKARHLELLNRYQGRDRDVVLWDESLLSSQHQAIERKNVKLGITWLQETIEEQGIGQPVEGRRGKSELARVRECCPAALAYLIEGMKLLDAEFQAQAAEGRRPAAVKLPTIDQQTLDAYIDAVESFSDFHVEPLADLLSVSQEPVRVLRAKEDGVGKGAAFIAYEIKIPKALNRIAVLDASYPIRTLERLDKTIQEDPGFPRNVKRYSDVTIHQLFDHAGRTSIEADFKKQNHEDRKISAEVCGLVKNLPSDQGVILFTFKTRPKKRPVDVEAILRRDLEAAGIDLKATVRDRSGVGQPRIVILRWGQETSLSEFSYCRHVVFTGVLHRAMLDMQGAYIAALNDLLADLSGRDVADVRLTEIVHALYQAMSRGSCRSVVNGEAEPMNAWLIYPDETIRKPIEAIMPGVTWMDWPAKYLIPEERPARDTAKQLITYLRSLPAQIKVISVRSLKAGSGLSGVTRSTFQRGLAMALQQVPYRKINGGHALERMFDLESDEEDETE